MRDEGGERGGAGVGLTGNQGGLIKDEVNLDMNERQSVQDSM